MKTEQRKKEKENFIRSIKNRETVSPPHTFFFIIVPF